MFAVHAPTFWFHFAVWCTAQWKISPLANTTLEPRDQLVVAAVSNVAATCKSGPLRRADERFRRVLAAARSALHDPSANANTARAWQAVLAAAGDHGSVNECLAGLANATTFNKERRTEMPHFPGCASAPASTRFHADPCCNIQAATGACCDRHTTLPATVRDGHRLVQPEAFEVRLSGNLVFIIEC